MPCLLCRLARYHLFGYAVITLIHFEPPLMPSIVLPFCSTMSACLVVSLPFSTGVVCPRPTHTDEPYPTFMAFIVSFSPRPNGLVAT